MSQFSDLITGLSPIKKPAVTPLAPNEPNVFTIYKPTPVMKSIKTASDAARSSVQKNVVQPVSRIASSASKTAVSGVMAGFEAIDKLAGAGVTRKPITGATVLDRYRSAPTLTSLTSENVERKAADLGFSPGVAKATGGLAAFAVGMIEPIPGPKSVMKLIGRDPMALLIKSETPEAASAVLKKYAPELTDSQLASLAPKIASSKTEQAVRDVLRAQKPKEIPVNKPVVSSMNAGNDAVETAMRKDGLIPENVPAKKKPVELPNGMNSVKTTKQALERAGYQPHEVNEILTDLADRVKTSIGKPAVHADDAFDAVHAFETARSKPEVIESKPHEVQLSDRERSRFKDGTEIVNEIARPKNGSQGLQLNNKVELQQLVDYMASVSDEGTTAERGIVSKPYGYSATSKDPARNSLDIHLGSIPEGAGFHGVGGKLVAEVSPTGKLTGRFRIHGTPIDSKEVVGRVNMSEFRALPEAGVSRTSRGMKEEPVALRSKEDAPNTTQLTYHDIVQNAEYKASKAEVARKTKEPKSEEEAPVVVRKKKSDAQIESKAIEETARQTGRPVKEVTGKMAAIKKVATKLVENLQDEAVRVKQIIKDKNIKVKDESNPYQKMTLYPGRVQAKIDAAYERSEKLIKDMQSMAKSMGSTLESVRKDVNEYLIARHAPERNAALGEGAAGMTTDEANVRMGQLESGPRGAKIREFADKAQEINREGLTLLKESGVISEELFNTLTEKYKNHVPLQRVMDDTEDIGAVLGSKGFDVRGTGIKRAKGSSREIHDVLTSIIANYEQSVMRSEKNLVDTATLHLIRDNAEAMKDIATVTHPRAIGRAFPENGEAEGRVLMEQTNDPSVLQMFEDGKRTWIKFKDPNVAEAFRGVGAEKINSLLKWSRSFVNLYSGLATRFNLDFALPNKIRDLQETAIYLAANKDVGAKGAAKVFMKDPASMKSVIDALRGKDTPGARLYHEMRAEGGTTGGFALSTRKQAELNLQRIERLATSKTQEVVANLMDYVDNWNTLFEDSTRLSVYKTAREKGLSKARAAELAKNASINFNRHGKWGPTINSLYMFANASIQGTAKTFESLKNPKVAAAFATTIAAAVTTTSEWNDWADPDWRDHVTKWDRLNGLPVVVPSTDGTTRYFTIPVSWAAKPFVVMMNYGYDSLTGYEVNPKDFVGNTLAAMVNAYNPVGGTNLTSALVPTIADVFVEVHSNESWSGAKIRNDYDPTAPADVQYFSSLGDTATGRAAISISELLHDKIGFDISPADINYYYEQYSGGAGRAVTKIANTAIGASEGELPPADNFPIFGRFYRERTAEEVGQGAGGDTEKVKELVQQQSRERVRMSMSAEKEYNRLKKLPTAQAASEWEATFKENPDLAKKITSIAKDDKLGLTYTDRSVKQLGVDNGERAMFIFKKLNGMKTDAEKGAYWSDLSKKKIMTKDVQKQVRYLLTYPEALKQK